MISSAPKVTARDLITHALPEAFESMKEATVKLTDGAQFTGSGVIIALSIRSTSRTMIVATAAHNIRVFIQSLSTARKLEIWGVPQAELTLDVMNARKQQAIDAFIAGASIHYTAVNMIGDANVLINGQAAITRVLLPDWKYDVCLLYAEVPTTQLPKYSAVRRMLEVQEASVLFQELLYKGKLPVSYRLLQAGYGRTNPANVFSAGNLNFKVSEFENDDGRAASYYDGLTGTCDDVLKLSSTAAWTSLPGDSGGPLFAVHLQTGKFYPIGVALGSDVTTDADEDAAWATHADGAHNNAVTSLYRLYEAWEGPGRDPASILLEDTFTF